MTPDLLEELELSLAWPTERQRGGLSLLLGLCWAEEPEGESNRRESYLFRTHYAHTQCENAGQVHSTKREMDEVGIVYNAITIHVIVAKCDVGWCQVFSQRMHTHLCSHSPVLPSTVVAEQS